MNKKPEKDKKKEDIKKEENIVKPKAKKKVKVKRNITSGIAFVQSTFSTASPASARPGSSSST